MEAWPSSVPFRIQQDSYARAPQSNVLRTDTATGPARQRRRYTAVPKNLSGVIQMTKTEYDTFETWFFNTIDSGALSFTMPNPSDDGDTDITARFKGPDSMTVSNDGPIYWNVSVELEELVT